MYYAFKHEVSSQNINSNVLFLVFLFFFTKKWAWARARELFECAGCMGFVPFSFSLLNPVSSPNRKPNPTSSQLTPFLQTSRPTAHNATVVISFRRVPLPQKPWKKNPPTSTTTITTTTTTTTNTHPSNPHPHPPPPPPQPPPQPAAIAAPQPATHHHPHGPTPPHLQTTAQFALRQSTSPQAATPNKP